MIFRLSGMRVRVALRYVRWVGFAFAQGSKRSDRWETGIRPSLCLAMRHRELVAARMRTEHRRAHVARARTALDMRRDTLIALGAYPALQRRTRDWIGALIAWIGVGYLASGLAAPDAANLARAAAVHDWRAFALAAFILERLRAAFLFLWMTAASRSVRDCFT